MFYFLYLEDFNIKSKIIIFCLIICLLIPLGAASASDINNTATDDQVLSATPNTDTLSAGVNLEQENDTLSVQNNENILSAGIDDSGNNNIDILKVANNEILKEESTGSFNDLNKLILSKSEGSIILLDQNYKYITGDSALTINKNNITIDGNGIYTIDASNSGTINVNGLNTTLRNLKITNTTSILWTAGYGKMEYIDFENTSGIRMGEYAEISHIQLSNSILPNYFLSAGSNSKLYDAKFKNISNTNIQTNLLSLDSNSLIKDCEIKNISHHIYRFHVGYVRIGENSVIDHITMSECNFTNDIGSDYPVISLGVKSKIINSDLDFKNSSNARESDRVASIIGSIIEIINCNISNTYYGIAGPTSVGYAALFASCTVKDCTITNATWGTYLAGSGITIENCDFINCTQGIHINGQTMTLIKDCDFINTTGGPVININGNLTILNNVNFINSSGTPDILIGKNMYYNFTEVHTENITDLGGFNFSPVTEIWVDSTNYTLASNVYYNGKCHFMADVYDFPNTLLDVNCNIIGEKGTIINNGGFNLKSSTMTIENIVFNNTAARSKLVSASTIKNCTFVNISNTNSLFYYGANGLMMINFTNCSFIDSAFTYVFQGSTTDGATYFSYLNFTNTNFTQVFYASDRLQNLYIDHMNITGGKFSSLIYGTASGYANANWYLNDIIIKNAIINRNLIDPYYIRSDGAAGNYHVDGLTLDNCTFNNGNVLFNCNVPRAAGYYYDNIYIKNLTTVKPIFSISDSITCNNIFLDNFTTESYLFGGAGSDTCSFNNINVNNVNATMGFNVNSILKSLHFNNCNFTQYLGNIGVNLEDSSFINISGHLNIMSDSVRITGSDFINCTSLSDGLINTGIFNHTRFTSCKFINNSAITGGVINIAGNDTSFYSCDFINNTAEIQGGAIYSGEKIYLYYDTYSGTNLTVEPDVNVPKVNGIYIAELIMRYNDIYLYLDAPNFVEINDALHTNDIATAFGLINPEGTIHVNGTNETFNITFANPELTTNNVKIIGSNTTYVNVNNTLVIGDLAYGTYLKDLIFQNSENIAILWKGIDGIIDNCTFRDNGLNRSTGLPSSNANYGVALDVEATGLKINDCTFTSNYVNGVNVIGGVIYVNASDLEIHNSLFDDNHVSSGIGSHIYLTDNSMHVLINTSCFNSGEGSAIGIYALDVEISNCTFKDNTAITGGALFIDTIDSVIINHINFTSNIASSNGGAIFISKGGVNIINGTKFISNGAIDGGAIYSNAALNVDGSDFISNTAANDGGALYIGGNADLENVNFTGNRAVEGSAFYIADDEYVNVKNVVLTDNVDSYHDSHPSDVCSIHVGDGANLNVLDNSLTLNDGQDIHYSGNWASDVLYVSNTASPKDGMTEDRPTTLENALQHISPNGKIILLSDYELVKTVTINNNQTNIQSKNDGKNRKITGNNKYLFIHLNQIK